MTITNAQIESTSLGTESHGIFTAHLHLTWASSGQSFGGYALDRHNGQRNSKSERIGTAYGMEFIRRILTTVGVDEWEELAGKYVRIQHEGLGGLIIAIGHITEDRWFNPKKDLQHLLNEDKDAAA